MHNPEYIFENGMNKVIWDFDIQTDHLISVNNNNKKNKKQTKNKTKKTRKKEPVEREINTFFFDFSILFWGLCHPHSPQSKIKSKRKEL